MRKTKLLAWQIVSVTYELKVAKNRSVVKYSKILQLMDVIHIKELCATKTHVTCAKKNYVRYSKTYTNKLRQNELNI
jgi:hypothetical protein